MIKGKNGITLVSLIITIGLMLIISSTVVYISLDRFQINEFNKMVNDIGLLEDKVSNYYLRYGGLPVLRDRSSKEPFQFDETKLTFTRNPIDNSVYYILDLEALDGISLNYGKDGFEAWKDYVENSSGDIPYNLEDVYIINENTHTIYYVKGINLKEKNYYYIKPGGALTDNIPPSRPQINIISGERNDEGVYITAVEVEILPGQDNWSGVGGIEYTIKKFDYTTKITSEQKFTHAEDSEKIVSITENGLYTIEAKTFDNANNYSEVVTIEFYVHIEHTLSNVTVEPTCTTEGIRAGTCTFEFCGVEVTETIPALGHDWETTRTDPTCTTDGEEGRTCKRCGEEESETIPKLGHAMNSGVVIESPTCMSTGTKKYSCTRAGCSYSYTETIKQLEHNYEYIGYVDPTCTTYGYDEYECTNGCGDMYTVDTDDPLGHMFTFSEYQVLCDHRHKAYYECTRCNWRYLEYWRTFYSCWWKFLYKTWWI